MPVMLRRSQKGGFVPGTAVHVGEQKVKEVRLSLIHYDKGHYEEKEDASIDECLKSVEKEEITWINVTGLHEVGITEELGNGLDIHPLIIEDILNTHQRPKVDNFGDYMYIVVKSHAFDKESNGIYMEQVSILLGKNYVVTFQEREIGLFDSIKERLKQDRGRIRKKKADYLAYTLLDSIIDSYFGVLEAVGDALEEIEEELISNPAPETLHDIHILKRETIMFRKALWPLREVVNWLLREESPLFEAETTIFLRDLYDHTIQVIDTVETYRDILSGMLDIYLSSISNRMNEIMKVLTIFATIFIPLTFITGIYGMNFNTAKSPFNMPELNWYLGYPLILGLMAAVGIVMLFFFKRKKWF